MIIRGSLYQIDDKRANRIETTLSKLLKFLSRNLGAEDLFDTALILLYFIYDVLPQRHLFISRHGRVTMNKEIKEMEKVLEIYTIAARREKAAYEFYKDVAEKVSTEEEKKILLGLAQFEMQHLKLMESHYEKTLKKIKELHKQS